MTAWLRRHGPALPVLAAAAFLLVVVHVSPFPAPDELEHVSYAAILQETGRWLPRFESNLDLYRNDLRLWSDRVNYIGHPSPYYLYVAQSLDRELPMEQAVARVRLASLLLLLGGLAAAVAARPFRGGLGWAYAVAVAWCPQVLTVGGQVNNDALAVLAGGLAFLGVLRGVAPAAALGVALALWAKPNAGLEVGLFTGFAWLLDPGRSWRMAGWLAAGAVLGLLPTIPVVLRYGTPVPVAAEAVWPVRSMGSFAEYWPVFLAGIGQSWGWQAYASWPMDAGGWARCVAVWAMLGLAVLGGVIGLRGRAGARGRAAAAAAAALCVVLPLHLGFAAARLGFSVPAAAFRYYLALWPGLACALLHAADASPRLRRPVLIVAAAAFLLGAIA